MGSVFQGNEAKGCIEPSSGIVFRIHDHGVNRQIGADGQGSFDGIHQQHPSQPMALGGLVDRKPADKGAWYWMTRKFAGKG